jgi:uncharacterized protein involved in oxidation of intracellular sulfur
MAKTLFILNDPPYGTERSYNALRIGDAASCAKAHQKVPPGYYNLEVMLRGAAGHGAAIGVCGTCMDARGIAETELTEGARRSTLDELTGWTQWADKVLVF